MAMRDDLTLLVEAYVATAALVIVCALVCWKVREFKDGYYNRRQRRLLEKTMTFHPADKCVIPVPGAGWRGRARRWLGLAS